MKNYYCHSFNGFKKHIEINIEADYFKINEKTGHILFYFSNDDKPHCCLPNTFSVTEQEASSNKILLHNNKDIKLEPKEDVKNRPKHDLPIITELMNIKLLIEAKKINFFDAFSELPKDNFKNSPKSENWITEFFENWKNGTNQEFKKVKWFDEVLEIPKDVFDKVNLRIKKPPLGLKPKYIHEMQRLNDINEAIKRYCDSDKFVPLDWFIEKSELEMILKEKDKNVKTSN